MLFGLLKVWTIINGLLKEITGNICQDVMLVHRVLCILILLLLIAKALQEIHGLYGL